MIRRTVYVLGAIALAGALIWMGGTAPAPALAKQQTETYTETIKSPIELEIWNPCSDELIHLSGTNHTTIHLTRSIDEDDEHGVYNAVFIDHPSGVTGVGQQTGTSYVNAGGGVQQHEVDNLQGASTVSHQLKIRFIAKGKNKTQDAQSFMFHLRRHVTVTPDGAESVRLEELRITCR